MTELDLPTDMGFAEFVSQLLREVYEGVTVGQLDEENKIHDLIQAAQMDDEVFARRFIDDGSVDAFLRENFPRETEEGHAVLRYAEYRPAGPGTLEDPPFKQVLGIQLARSDYVIRRDGPIELKLSAVEKIRLAARKKLAQNHNGAIQEMVNRGVPRLLVDTARVKAKMTFQLLRIEDAEKPEIRSRLAGRLQALRPAETLLANRLLSSTRVVIRQADERAPGKQLDVYGEVEVTYKMIS